MERESWRDQVEMLVNRIRKNRRRMRSWIKRENVTCYRLYDRDIPELPFAIDWYDGCLHVSEYTSPYRMAEVDHKKWVKLILTELARALDARQTDLYVKSRAHAKGGTQYGELSNKSARLTAQESGLKFLVNLSDRVDTGLFLDHRRTRQMVRQEAKEKRFLNLFAYTGTFTVYAAAGGATETTTIDMSNTYLDWARANMKLNSFVGPEHRFIRDDILKVFNQGRAADEGRLYDLIVLDPPTVSKSKRMERDLDIQRDHPFLLQKTFEICAPGAIVFFSSNFSKFKFQADRLPFSKIEEITKKTIPPDFHNKRAHRCWRLEV